MHTHSAAKLAFAINAAHLPIADAAAAPNILSCNRGCGCETPCTFATATSTSTLCPDYTAELS